MEIDQQSAIQLLEQCATLIIAGVPDKTEFGIDLYSISVTEEFRGVKMIPEGVHYVYCASKGVFNDLAPRVGFLHYFKRGEIVVREWNSETEELQLRTKGDVLQEKIRIRENLKHLDKFLAPYDFQNLQKWINLSGFLKESTILKISPEGGIIRNTAEFLSCPDAERPRGKPSSSLRTIKIKSAEDENKYLPDLKIIAGTTPTYTKLPERFTKDTPPAEVTFNNIDTVNLVDQLLSIFPNENEFLEEIQYSFLMYMCGLSVDSLAHWRKILSLLANSDKAVGKYKSFYKKFVNILKHQLPEIPVEFIEQSRTNTIYMDLRNLLINLWSNNLGNEASDMKNHIEKYMTWIFDDLAEEDPEDLPQIVDIECEEKNVQ